MWQGNRANLKKLNKQKNWHTSKPKGHLPDMRKTIERGINKIVISPSVTAWDTTYMFIVNEEKNHAAVWKTPNIFELNISVLCILII